MTDHIPADKIQDILTGISNGVYEVEAGRGVSGIAEDLRALLPAPTPRTLVQLIREHGDHHKYQWCQATRGYQDGRQEGVIIRPGMTSSIFMARDGQTYRVGNEDITPHPDLPPMAWPTSEPVTESTPEPDPQPGEAWLIEYEGKHYEAVYWYSPIYAHWAIVENREGLKTVESAEAAPVTRLVPKQAPSRPARLVTMEDYLKAPVGTIVGDYLARPAGKAEVMWQKLENGRWWKVGGSYYADMAGESRAIIRWGGVS